MYALVATKRSGRQRQHLMNFAHIDPRLLLPCASCCSVPYFPAPWDTVGLVVSSGGKGGGSLSHFLGVGSVHSCIFYSLLRSFERRRRRLFLGRTAHILSIKFTDLCLLANGVVVVASACPYLPFQIRDAFVSSLRVPFPLRLSQSTIMIHDSCERRSYELLERAIQRLRCPDDLPSSGQC